jgi:hypothetical protein
MLARTAGSGSDGRWFGQISDIRLAEYFAVCVSASGFAREILASVLVDQPRDDRAVEATNLV